MNSSHFLQFIDTMDALVSRASNEAAVLDEGEAALKLLIAHDDWLPAEYAQPVAERYQSYCLYLDPQARYSVISFVWAPGQGTAVHNHTVWGLVGVLRGAERCEEFAAPLTQATQATQAMPAMQPTHQHTLLRGEVDRVSPAIGDWHKVSNAAVGEGETSVSIHVYGADIGRVHRQYWDAAKQMLQPMISGYGNDTPWIGAR